MAGASRLSHLPLPFPGKVKSLDCQHLFTPQFPVPGAALLEGMSTEAMWAVVTAAAATTPASPLCCRHRFWRKEATPARGFRDAWITWSPPVPEEVMQPPSGFGSARKKVSCYSVGVAGFRAPGLHPVPNPQHRGRRRSCLCAYTVCYLPCFVHHPLGPTKGQAKQVIPGPWLLPSPCSSLEVALTTNTCFLSLRPWGVQLFYWLHMHSRNIIYFNYNNYTH